MDGGAASLMMSNCGSNHHLQQQQAPSAFNLYNSSSFSRRVMSFTGGCRPSVLATANERGHSYLQPPSAPRNISGRGGGGSGTGVGGGGAVVGLCSGLLEREYQRLVTAPGGQQQGGAGGGGGGGSLPSHQPGQFLRGLLFRKGTLTADDERQFSTGGHWGA